MFHEDRQTGCRGTPLWFGETDPGATTGPRRVRRACGALVTLDSPDAGHVPRL
ncbi:hypothetical protein ACGF5O_01575 [Streptomyces sp. NPDC048291]|uniref:hypothetical protein n=1 Tax=Streptomyces sp. NPDC048291 TaxID=3365530 RepID=UPI00370F8176